LTTEEEFASMYDIFTLEDVISEIRDERARLFLQNLPYNLQVKPAVAINEADIQTVEDFSKETGDKNTLSRVDKLLIAFGMTLSREKDEYSQVNKTPQKLEEFRPKSMKPYYEDDGQDDSDDEKRTFKPDDGWTTKVDNTPFDDF
jgi:rRNA maturation endonuclease Nob1